MNNWSIFGSAVKVYPSKNHRTSRSYRSSSFAPQHSNVFLDDDPEPDLFDRLVSDEKVKGQNQSNLASFIDPASQTLPPRRKTILKDVVNSDNTLSNDQSTYRKKTKTKKRDKENAKHQSRLFLDDDDNDPYFFNFDSNRSTRVRPPKRPRSSKIQPTKIDLREQKIKSTKLKKAQELREKQQQERAQCRMSRVCSTPTKDTSRGKVPAPDVSLITDAFADCSPKSPTLSNTTSIRNECVEKSSEIFMSETSKPAVVRKKLSFIDTFRAERKTMSPNLVESSCCGKDDRKTSGSSDARSDQSENSHYITCLKNDSVRNGVREDRENVFKEHRRSRSLETSRMSDSTDFCESKRSASQSLLQETHSNEIVAPNDIDSECENENITSGSCVENMEDYDSYVVERTSFSCGRRSNDSCIVDSELSESDLKILNSDVSEDEVDELAHDVDNLNLSTESRISNEPNSPCQSDLSDRPSRASVSNQSDPFSEYELSLNWSMQSDENGIVRRADRSKILTDRSRTKSSNFCKQTSDCDLESRSRISEQPDFGNKSNVSDCSESERSSCEPLSDKEPVHNRRAMIYFSPVSSPSIEDRSFESTELEDSNADKKSERSSFVTVTTFASDSSSIEVTPTADKVREESAESEEANEESFMGSTAFVTSLANITMRRKRTRFIRSSDTQESFENTTTSECDAVENCDVSVIVASPEGSPFLSDSTSSCDERTVVENKAINKMMDESVNDLRELRLNEVSPIEKTKQRSVLSNLFEEKEKEYEGPNTMQFESTRISKDFAAKSESFTILLDDTFSNEKTVVENNAANDVERTLTEGQVTLKMDDCSPIQSVEQSSIVSTVKRRHRKAPLMMGQRQHFVPFDTLSEENENSETEGDEEKVEDTRTNSSTSVFLRPTIRGTNDGRNLFPESSFDTTARQLSQSRFNNSLAVHLEKGKKWRRSFLAFKNIINHQLSFVAKEDCGRLCNKQIENLIHLQKDATFIMKELEECSTLKTGSDEAVVAGFEEGDTIAARYERQEKARFSLSINVPNSVSSDVAGRIPRFENVDDDHLRDCTRLPLIGEHDIEAGDFADISRWNSTLLEERSCASTNVARKIVLKQCGQTEPVPFGTRFSDRILKNCSKIGEGVYGEVFMLKRGPKKSVIKIIPIEGDELVNGERQKTFEEIFSELAITSHLSELNKRGGRFYTECFARLTNCHCVYGRYPQRLITLWKEYDLSKGSENDSPTMFKEDQLYVILELDHGGEDIESFTFKNAQQTLSVFNQVANALAVAERAFQFEHRDLHWGNVLVSRCTRKKTKFVIEDRENEVSLSGVKVTIIDYTLSRVTIEKHTLFNDLGRDPDLFIAEGDFQFEVYRMMRNAVKDVWDEYAPVTNVYWLRYLLDKMVKEMKYERSSTLLHQKFIAELKQMYEKILLNEYDSAYRVAYSGLL